MTDNEMKQISIKKLLLFVFAPALLMLGAYCWAVQFRAAVPPFLSFIIIILVVLIPSEIGVILYHSKKENGKLNFQSAFIMQEKIPAVRVIGISAILVLMAAIVFTFLSPIESRIAFGTLFRGIPEYFKLADFFQSYTSYPRGIVITSLVLYAIANGILGPIAEELYFRGFLMPRINRFGNWAPVIIAVLFSAYHLFSPWEFITRIIACLPFVYYVYKKKNIYIGMVVHCTINTVSVIIGIMNLLSA